nr:immunoglobulin light chain junction region [Macaca mulatta]
CQQYYGQPHTF